VRLLGFSKNYLRTIKAESSVDIRKRLQQLIETQRRFCANGEHPLQCTNE
jgi:flagellar hook protein FlgE